MADEFASDMKRMLDNPRCKGVTFFRTGEGRWQVSAAVDNLSNWNANIDANPLTALWKCMQRFKI